MRIDSYGCLVMEKDGMPGDLGDSSAETGRYVILLGMLYMAKIKPFRTELGYVRHPDAPEKDAEGNSWREPDFTSDQALYLLMAADLFDFLYAAEIAKRFESWGWRTAPSGKLCSLDVVFLSKGWYQAVACANVVQMLINKFPWRWDDGHANDATWGWFRSRFWRFVSSDDMTVSYMTVYTAMVFLKRKKNITWPQRFWDREKYLAKTKAYYQPQPNSTWFVELFERAPL